MKIGFTTLALFGKTFEGQMSTARNDGFDMVEILCEGPTLPRLALKNLKAFESAQSYGLELVLHSPTVDLNPASLNIGIRDETLRQLNETTDFAAAIEATTITTHPGQASKMAEWIINASRSYALELLSKWAEYTRDVGILPSIENMPNRQVFFCRDVKEHFLFVESTGSAATVDLGHANTNHSLLDFLAVNYEVAHHHLSDNDGLHDQHLQLGKGTLNTQLLSDVKKAFIEMNDYDDVLRSRNVLVTIDKHAR